VLAEERGSNRILDKELFVGSRGELVVLTVSFVCKTRRICWAGQVD